VRLDYLPSLLIKAGKVLNARFAAKKKKVRKESPLGVSTRGSTFLFYPQKVAEYDQPPRRQILINDPRYHVQSLTAPALGIHPAKAT